MKTIQAAAVATVILSRSVLDATPARALSLLRGIGLSTAIRGSMQKAGYRAADHSEGWTLLVDASGTTADTASTTNPVAAATTETEDWYAIAYARGKAVLRRKHPQVEAYVYQDLEGGHGPEALVEATIFLDRLDSLESSPERKSTRKDDHAALESLAQRGITKDARKQARQLLAIIQKQPIDETEAPVQSDKTVALMKLHAWVTDWSETARTVITNRAQLIQLGISKRRTKKIAVPPVVAPPNPITTSPVAISPIATSPAAPAAPALPPVTTAPALPAATPTPPAAVEAPSVSATAPNDASGNVVTLSGPALNGATHGALFKAPAL